MELSTVIITEYVLGSQDLKMLSADEPLNH